MLFDLAQVAQSPLGQARQVQLGSDQLTYSSKWKSQTFVPGNRIKPDTAVIENTSHLLTHWWGSNPANSLLVDVDSDTGCSVFEIFV